MTIRPSQLGTFDTSFRRGTLHTYLLCTSGYTTNREVHTIPGGIDLSVQVCRRVGLIGKAVADLVVRTWGRDHLDV